MPANYTHRVFGREVLAVLSPAVLCRIQDNPLLFQMGLHGPDLLFYYKPLCSTPLGKLGHSLHNHTGREVLTVLLDAVGGFPASRQDAAMAYTLGFACHYLLDSACHPYVYGLIQSGKADHCTIEAQMDLWLMVRDGLSPLETDSVSHLSGMRQEDFAVIAPLFAALSKIASPHLPLKVREKQIASAHGTMQLLCHIFGARSAIVRGLTRAGLFLSGNYESRKGMIFSKAPDPAFDGCNRHMMNLMEDAIRETPILLECICRHDLSERFDRTFEGAVPQR